jgi:hypothetical protein
MIVFRSEGFGTVGSELEESEGKESVVFTSSTVAVFIAEKTTLCQTGF